MFNSLHQRFPRRARLCAAILGGLSAAAVVPAALGQSATAGAPALADVRQYSLAAGPLGAMLKEIAAQSGRKIEFVEADVAPHAAPAISGKFTTIEVVRLAAEKSGLEAQEDPSGAIHVGAHALSTVYVTAKRDQAEDSFKADRSDTATRSGTDLMDVPASVTIITSKVLETQQVTTLTDALANVSSVSYQVSPQGSPTITVRGFSNPALMVNGVSDQSAAESNVFSVERIEVLKGPQAILAGANSLGGGVNIVTKKPQAAPLASVYLQYGSFGDATIAGDVGGALIDDKKLSYRLIVSDAHARDNQAGFDGRTDETFFPQIRWKDSTDDLIVGLSYGKQYSPAPEYTFALKSGQILPAPSVLLGNRDDGFNTEQKRAFYEYEHKFSDGVTFVSKIQRSLDELRLHVFGPFGLQYDDTSPISATNPAQGVIFPTNGLNNSRTTSGDHYFRVEGDTGELHHKLSAGLSHTDYTYFQTDWDGNMETPQIYPPEPYSYPEILDSTSVVADTQNWRETEYAAYAQDLISYGKWNLLLNLRRSQYKQGGVTTYVEDNNFQYTTPTTTNWHTTPGAGVIYSVTPEASLYASYAQGFTPSTTVECGGGVVPPMQSSNREIGAKFDLLNHKLSLTTSVYNLKQGDSTYYNPAKNCETVGPGQHTKGAEIDVQGELTKGWMLMMNYATASIRNDGKATTIYPSQPHNKINIWTVYDLPGDRFKGWGLGFGLNAQSSSLGNEFPTNQFRLPGQTKMDTSVFYDQSSWHITMGIKNITDKTLYGASVTNSYIPVLNRRTYMLTVKHDFK